MLRKIRKGFVLGAVFFGLVLGLVAVRAQVVQAEEENAAVTETAQTQEAKQLPCTITRNGSAHIEKLADNNYKTTQSIKKDDVITVSVPEGESIYGLYIMWDNPVKPWTLITAEGEETHGENGFLHEYVPMTSPQSQVTIVPTGSGRISDIKVIGEGTLPDWVQIWQPPCEKADILIVSSHADDEILFFGGVIPTYHTGEGASVQIVYMTEFWTTTPIREHEKLDGLWASGLDIYPVCGDFKDLYSKTLEKARTQYDEEEMVKYLTEQFRRFKPQVVVTHDFNGEYGHGYHMLTATATAKALENAVSLEVYPEQVEQYGTWDVPKTYIHLYGENKIRLDLRIPMEEFGGKTALEVAAEAYKQHVSQQWCWFYVSDEYEYSCADFGLYRTNVGTDTSNNMLENIITYSEQERIAAEKAEAERLAAEEEARRLAEEEARRLEEEKRLAEEKAAAQKAEEERIAAEAEAKRLAEEEARIKAEKQEKLILTGSIAGGIFITLCIIFWVRLRLKRARNKKRGNNRK